MKQKYRYTTVQKIYSIWLILFFLFCLYNSLFIFYSEEGFDYLMFSMLLPFIAIIILWLLLLISIIYNKIQPIDLEDNDCIKNTYPSIWKELHPFGDSSRNSFAGLMFSRGKYDDGSDEKLNQIKFKQLVYYKLIMGTLIMVPVLWCCNTIAYLLEK